MILQYELKILLLKMVLSTGEQLMFHAILSGAAYFGLNFRLNFGLKWPLLERRFVLKKRPFQSKFAVRMRFTILSPSSSLCNPLFSSRDLD